MNRAIRIILFAPPVMVLGAYSKFLQILGDDFEELSEELAKELKLIKED